MADGKLTYPETDERFQNRLKNHVADLREKDEYIAMSKKLATALKDTNKLLVETYGLELLIHDNAWDRNCANDKLLADFNAMVGN